MGKSSSVKRLNRKRSNKKKSTRKRKLKGGVVGKRKSIKTSNSINSYRAYPRDRFILRTFSSGAELHESSDKNMIENIKDYMVNGCTDDSLLHILRDGHSKLTSGKQTRPLTLNELKNGTHEVTKLEFYYSNTWLLIRVLDTGGQQVVGHIEFEYDQPLYIYSICTRQGHGYGKILLYSLFKHFQALKLDYELYSLDEARGFYNKIGFKADYEFTHEPSTWDNPGNLKIKAWQIKKILSNYPGRIVKPTNYR